MALWEELLVELDKPGGTMEGVKLPSQVGVQGNTQADLLATVGRLGNPLYPLQQPDIHRCEQRGEPPPEMRKVGHEPSYPVQILCKKSILM